ncbi:MAG: hypothetical protein IJ325_11855 [Clostridia bacterium]|nr:hypothetical protein [Clostridia bacterium]
MNHSAHPNKNNSRKDTKNSNKAIAIVIGVLLIIAILLAVFRGCENEKPGIDNPVETDPGIVYDDSAVEGGWNEADTDKIIASLNAKVEEGMINISMNTSPNFREGTAEGNLMIVNEGINRYPQVVEISRNDTGEMIYKSGAIPVGSKIEHAKLSVDLPAGTYDCTAMFYNVDPNTGSYLGCAGAIISITVLE